MSNDAKLQAALLAAIAAQLPETTVGVLRSELEELPKVRDLLSLAQSDIANLKRERETLQRENKQLTEQLVALRAREDAVAKRESALLERELKASLLELENKLRNDFAARYTDMVALVFRSPVYETRVQKTVPVAVEGYNPAGPNGSYSGVQQQPMVQNVAVSELTQVEKK